MYQTEMPTSLVPTQTGELAEHLPRTIKYFRLVHSEISSVFQEYDKCIRLLHYGKDGDSLDRNKYLHGAHTGIGTC